MSAGPGRREVAYRLFAAEFEDADHSYSESDEERAPNYVVTPTGARVNRLFAVGVLTELDRVNEEMLRARVVDPTGAFVVYAGQYQPDELAFLERIDPPAFVSVTGKARTFQPEDSDRVYSSVRPESISEVDAGTRDRWVVQAAERTAERVATVAGAKRTGLAGEDLRAALEEAGVDPGLAAGIPIALDHYGTTGSYLRALRETALDAARVVAGERDEARDLAVAPGEGDDAELDALADPDVAAARPSAPADEPPTADAAAESGDAESATAAASAGTPDPTADTEAGPADSTAETDAGSAAEAATGETTEETAGEPTAVASAESESAAEPSTAEAEAGGAEPGGEESATEPRTAVTTDRAEPTAETSPAEADAETASAGTTETAGAESNDETEDEAADELGSFEPGEFDMPDEERDRVEEEFGTEFETGNEVDEAGAAGIDSGADPVTEAESAEPASQEQSGAAPADEAESATADEPEPQNAERSDPASAPSTDRALEGAAEPEAEASTAAADAPADAEDVDLSEAVIEVLAELDDGDGVAEGTLVEAVVDRYGVDADAVEDAVQDALMSGRCYEPEDGVYKPI